MRQQHYKKRVFNRTEYFNEWEYKQALEMILINPVKAEFLYREYIEKYPLDSCAYGDYAYVLMILRKFDDAEDILNIARTLFEEENCFRLSPIDRQKLNDRMIFDSLKLLSFQERYEELYSYCKENAQKIDELKLGSIAFFSKIRSGRPAGRPREKYSYRSRQIIEYHEEEFLEHIKKHLADYNLESNDNDNAIFAPGFPVDKVFAEVKKYIPSDMGLCIGFCDNKYFFRYDNCGRVKNKLVNYFVVVCLHNSTDFITMYPVEGAEELPCVDLNYLVPEKEDVKTRRRSQIDKFNQRYKRNN